MRQMAISRATKAALKALSYPDPDIRKSYRIVRRLEKLTGNTDIFIHPGYTFRFIDDLLTNFHTPESTLLMLVSALAGRENMLRAYSHAIEERYRFFSYGDACFIRG